MRIATNLILLLSCIYLVWLSREELKPEQKKSDSHLLQDLPWETFQSLKSPLQNYAIHLKPTGPELMVEGKTIPIRMQRFQDYLDNWLLLPKPQLIALEDSREAYGFNPNPDLIFEFQTEKHSFSVGRMFLGNVFVGYEKNQVFLVPDIFKNNLLWGPTQFLHHSFYSEEDLPYEILRIPLFLNEKTLILRANTKTSSPTNWITGHRLLAVLSTLGASPTLREMPSDCQPFLKTSKDKMIYGCPEGFYFEPGVFYSGGEFVQELLVNWDLFFLSDKLEDYLPQPLSELVKIRTDSGLYLQDGEEHFLKKVQKLTQVKLHFSWLFDTGTPAQMTLYYRNGHKETLTGYRVQIHSRPHFAMLLKDRVLVSFPLGILQ